MVGFESEGYVIACLSAGFTGTVSSRLCGATSDIVKNPDRGEPDAQGKQQGSQAPGRGDLRPDQCRPGSVRWGRIEETSRG